LEDYQMFDATKLLDQMMGTAERYAGKENVDKVRKTIAENPDMAKAAGVTLAAILLGSKGGRQATGGAMKLGGLAVVGGLAYQAWQNWQRKQGGDAQLGDTGTQPPELTAPPADSPFATHVSANDRAKASLVAMIASAKADGHIDSAEQQRIKGRMNDLVDDPEAKTFLLDEMMAPNDMERVAALATTPERAMEIYTASCIAIALDHPEERAWLDRLAKRLGLDPALTEEIERSVTRERATA
jgi:uncharacterized membrane protein YebE (DUF533 family)